MIATILYAVLMLPSAGWVDRQKPGWTVIDGQTLASGSATYRLAGLEAHPLRAVCDDLDARTSYRCGITARAALRRMIRNRQVTCRQIGVKHRSFQCFADGIDIGQRLVAEGLGIALANHPATLRPEIDHSREENSAKSQKLGIWRGPLPDPVYAKLTFKKDEIIVYEKRKPVP